MRLLIFVLLQGRRIRLHNITCDTYMNLQLARHAVAIGGNADGAGDGKGGGGTRYAHGWREQCNVALIGALARGRAILAEIPNTESHQQARATTRAKGLD